MRKALCLLLINIFIVMCCAGVSAADSYDATTETVLNQIDLNESDQIQIDSMVNGIIKKSRVPGMSIVLFNEEQTKYLSYGQADKEQAINVTQDTLFEIGSMSKAFTALGILWLEDEGALSLEDPITKYIPWLTFQFHGYHEGKEFDGEVELKISDFLYQTSGIPFKTLGDIPVSTADNALEETIKMLTGTNLDFYPGDRHQYTTINYDVLGYVIQVVSGQTYEGFIQEEIISPLGLNNTFLFQNEAQATGHLAQGYKMSFFQAKPYDAPRYRGNTPAGYIFSNAVDMERWMRIQLDLIETSDQFRRIIERSHIGDTTVASQGSYYYGAGWHVNTKGNYLRHGGSNPNYSSMIVMRPEEKTGICILTNMDSNAAEYLADNILNVVEGREITTYSSDMYKNLDFIFSTVIIIAILLGLFFFVLIFKIAIDICQKKRSREKLRGAKIAGILLAVPLTMFFGFCIYYLPNILFDRLSWTAVNVWGSPSVMAGCFLGFAAFCLFMVYVLLSFNYIKKNEKGYLALIPLSLINGVASALIIFTINESFNRNMEYSRELLVYFVFALSFFVYTIKLLQGRMIIITNELAYEKRMQIIEKVMSSSYQSIERIGRNRIFSGLNNDCAALVKVPEIIILFISNLLTLLFCLSYLLTKSLWTFVASLGIILLNGVISIITSSIAARYWEKNRDIQDTFFGQMQDLVDGFKELVLNKLRRLAFWMDMKKYSRMSTELNKTASVKFLNFSLYNVLMYNIVFGVVVFVFPLFIFNLNVNQLRENLFIVFYMIGPFGALAGAVPQLTQLNVNVKRINKLISDLDEASAGNEKIEEEFHITYPDNISIKFENVMYKYITEDPDSKKAESEFTLGPITTELKSGEITFITGGNGSGKSTLGKLITGLYTPQEGRVLINGKTADVREQNELFSTIYSDFNLFKKLYGIDYHLKKDITMEYLDMMKIKDKIEINDAGEFKSIDLSTGQRKRLAFVVSCLEDKPMVLFDEWAAEQDPEFRRYFYDELLPMLKQQGKGIIVITHDDRYFDRADKVIKMERGIWLS